MRGCNSSSKRWASNELHKRFLCRAKTSMRAFNGTLNEAFSNQALNGAFWGSYFSGWVVHCARLKGMWAASLSRSNSSFTRWVNKQAASQSRHSLNNLLQLVIIIWPILLSFISFLIQRNSMFSSASLYATALADSKAGFVSLAQKLHLGSHEPAWWWEGLEAVQLLWLRNCRSPTNISISPQQCLFVISFLREGIQWFCWRGPETAVFVREGAILRWSLPALGT